MRARATRASSQRPKHASRRKLGLGVRTGTRHRASNRPGLHTAHSGLASGFELSGWSESSHLPNCFASWFLGTTNSESFRRHARTDRDCEKTVRRYPRGQATGNRYGALGIFLVHMHNRPRIAEARSSKLARAVVVLAGRGGREPGRRCRCACQEEAACRPLPRVVLCVLLRSQSEFRFRACRILRARTRFHSMDSLVPEISRLHAGVSCGPFASFANVCGSPGRDLPSSLVPPEARGSYPSRSGCPGVRAVLCLGMALARRFRSARLSATLREPVAAQGCECGGCEGQCDEDQGVQCASRFTMHRRILARARALSFVLMYIHTSKPPPCGETRV